MVGARKIPGKMNKTEGWYFEQLKAGVLAGRFISIRYEPVSFRLAPNTTYTPDFMVVFADGHIEFHETKGTWKGRGQDNARTKLKVTAEMYPEFTFKAIVIKRYQIHSIEDF